MNMTAIRTKGGTVFTVEPTAQAGVRGLVASFSSAAVEVVQIPGVWEYAVSYRCGGIKENSFPGPVWADLLEVTQELLQRVRVLRRTELLAPRPVRSEVCA